MAWSDTGKYMYQLQLMLLVDYTMTNTHNFSLAEIVGFVPDALIGGIQYH